MLKSIARTINESHRRFKARFMKPVKKRLKYELARMYRPLLDKTCFIGITGSCGKTTTTELIAAILSLEGKVLKQSHENTSESVVKTILGVRRGHRFCISEMSADGPGVLERLARLLRPQIGVVTQIGQDHYSNYRTLEATAAEKGKLIESLPAGGTAVLNADDPHVLAMSSRTSARIITYGLSEKAVVRAGNVSCAWPQTMSFDLLFGQEQLHVQTRLLGEHWIHVVLAAIATGIAAGVPLKRAVDAIEAFKPIHLRMSPRSTADGFTFVSDCWKNPMWALPAAMDFMSKAKADRKIVIIGSISDTPRSFSSRYKAASRMALGAADKVLLLGDHAVELFKSSPAETNSPTMAFCTIAQLNAFLDDFLRPGDLVLLKGVQNTDHLHRIVLARLGKVSCWSPRCDKKRYCDNCRFLRESDAHGTR